jgi:hypothetical protein
MHHYRIQKKAGRYKAGSEGGKMTLKDLMLKLRGLVSDVEEEEITLEDPVVDPVVPVPPTAAATGCGCGGTRTAAGKGDEKMKSEYIKRILAAKGTCFAEADVKALEAFEEERLKTMAEHLETAATAPPFETPAQKQKRLDEEAAAAAAMKTKSAEGATPDPTPTDTPEARKALREQFLMENPDIAEIVVDHKTRAAARKTELVSAVAATASEAYTKEELEAMTIPSLEKLAKFAGAKPGVDFSGLGAPRAASSDKSVDAPPNMMDRIRAARGESKSA